MSRCMEKVTVKIETINIYLHIDCPTTFLPRVSYRWQAGDRDPATSLPCDIAQMEIGDLRGARPL